MAMKTRAASQALQPSSPQAQKSRTSGGISSAVGGGRELLHQLPLLTVQHPGLTYFILKIYHKITKEQRWGQALSVQEGQWGQPEGGRHRRGGSDRPACALPKGAGAPKTIAL